MSDDSPERRIRELGEEIRRHDELYYRQTSPEITDREYDRLKAELAEVTMRADTPVSLSGDDAARMQKLLDVLEDLDDVQEVYHNAELN